MRMGGRRVGCLSCAWMLLGVKKKTIAVRRKLLQWAQKIFGIVYTFLCIRAV